MQGIALLMLINGDRLNIFIYLVVFSWPNGFVSNCVNIGVFGSWCIIYLLLGLNGSNDCCPAFV